MIIHLPRRTRAFGCRFARTFALRAVAKIAWLSAVASRSRDGTDCSCSAPFRTARCPVCSRGGGARHV
jgi:hypothetical protein